MLCRAVLCHPQVGADHRRKASPCEDVVAWRTPLGGWPQLGLFCVFDGHNSRNASEQAQQLLPDLLMESLSHQQQQQQSSGNTSNKQQQEQQQGQQEQAMQDSLNPQVQQQQQDHQQSHLQQQQQQQGDHQQTPQQQQQQPPPVLSDEVGVAAALTASFLATDEALTTDDGCTATAVLLEGCGDGGLLLRVANVGDSLALMVDLRRYVSVCRGEGGLSMLAEYFVGGAGRGAGGVWGRGAAAEGGICGGTALLSWWI